MTPLYFGSGRRTLFGLYHPPGGHPARATGVVICNPFGHEAIRAHRALRQLARLLARARFHVLRFDYYGTSDSAGDGAEVSMADWLEDIATATDELKDTAGVARVSWVGLRYGATLALAAAVKNGRRDLDSLVLWDPIVDGSAYLRELAETHVAYLRAELPEGTKIPAPDGREAVGFPLPTELRREIEAVDLAGGGDKPRARRLVLFASHPSDAYLRLCARLEQLGLPCQRRDMPLADNWNSDRAMNAALIPPGVLEAIVASLEGA